MADLRDAVATILNRCLAVRTGEAAAVSFAVSGPEGGSGSALRSADVVCATSTDALDVLLDPQALSATLRP